jgi:prevent-host-death family protein
MRTTPLSRARAEFSDIVDRALAGEPQRVTRHGKEAVVVVSEAEWAARPGPPPKSVVGALIAWSEAARAAEEDLGEDLFADRGWYSTRRELGRDFID